MKKLHSLPSLRTLGITPATLTHIFLTFSHTAGKGSHVETCLLTAHGEIKPFSEGEMLDLLILRSSNMSDAGGESKPRLSSKEQKQQMA